ncbi:LacI family DNA-binding transcriptional regulator [Zobellella denitrificans]|uniref:LacI family DNA-binding transcriptional regulator n=1 Tax=Zobellella denitrificans TaxID=347534 RepID=UPI001595E12C|nr:substrate-binding domain-containing protein [Zobellella denitrificans]
MVTLKDLAEHLGLSQATVSRALNGYPEVNEKTRRRVLEASKQLNYLPNLGARKLATGKSGMVGIVLKSCDELVQAPEYVRMIAQISRHLGDAGYDLLINSARQGNALDSFKRFVAGRAVDGLILNTPEVDDERVAFLQEQGFPFVMHGRTAGEVSYPYYDIDNYDALVQASRFLLDLGHRRIALLTGPARQAFALERARAFRDTLAQEGLAAELIAFDDSSEEVGYHHARLWLGGEAPTAIICASAPQAQGVYRAAGELGITIGRELSVIAHDDVVSLPRTEHFDPPLTVTRSSFMDACQPLAEMMVALLDGAEPRSLQQVAPVELIVRRSCGPCPRP